MSVVHVPKRLECSSEYQLRLWVEGESVHRLFERLGKLAEECTPDFSCCRPHLRWPVQQRRAFARACPKTRRGMLTAALAALVEDVQGRKATITPGGAVLVPEADPERKPS